MPRASAPILGRFGNASNERRSHSHTTFVRKNAKLNTKPTTSAGPRGLRGIKSALGGYRTNASADFQIFFCSVISQRVAFGQSRVRRRRALTLRGSFPAVKCCAGGIRALGR